MTRKLGGKMKIVILNSKGHWTNGWVTEPKFLQTVVGILEKSSFEVHSIEVENEVQLEMELDKISPDTLVWVNAYWIDKVQGEADWLNTYVEKRDLLLVGQSQRTLEALLCKDDTQVKMQNTGLPVPAHIVIRNSEVDKAKILIAEGMIDFPMVVKPTNESRSAGVKIVENMTEAIAHIDLVFERYPQGNIIIEEFLPSEDITCGYIELNGEALLLPTYLVVEGMNCESQVYSEDDYLRPNSRIKHVCVSESSVLIQLEEYVPRIIDLFKIESITRVDTRANKNGELNFFDINGMPGLNFPESATIKQCFVHFSDYEKEYIFECLINTIVLDKLKRNNLNVPEEMETHNLFNLKSDTVIKVKAVKIEQNIELI